MAWAFLSSSRNARRGRDVLLLLFAHTTYFVAPVVGFGMLLMILGFASTHKAAFRLAYLLSILALLIYKTPWQSALLQSGWTLG